MKLIYCTGVCYEGISEATYAGTFFSVTAKIPNNEKKVNIFIFSTDFVQN